MHNIGDSRSRVWTPESLSRATQGVPFGEEWVATGVCFDSGEVKPGDLFIALKGEKVDGHEFILDAQKRGAVAFLVQTNPEILLKNTRGVGPLAGVQVRDTREAMWTAAQWIRDGLNARIMGVTGSVGKTSTKALLGYLLGKQAVTFSDAKSLNTKIGVALTLMRASPHSQFGVVELGMNQPGEIAPLAKLLRLDYALITMIAAVHQAAFPGIKEIAQEKFSITQGLLPEGPLLLNGDMPSFNELKTQSEHPVFSYGSGKDVDLRLLEWRVSDVNETTVKACFKNEKSFEFSVQGIGYPRVMCALGALLSLKVMGGNLDKALLDLPHFPGVDRRGIMKRYAIGKTPLSESYVTIIDESYNASPVSVEQGLESLAAYQKTFKGRSIAVLGDMLELGDQSQWFHEEVGSKIVELGIQGVYLCGPLMRFLRDRLPSHLVWGYAETSCELAQMILEEPIQGGDIYMVKGSFGMNMIHIIKKIEDQLKKKGA